MTSEFLDAGHGAIPNSKTDASILQAFQTDRQNSRVVPALTYRLPRAFPRKLQNILQTLVATLIWLAVESQAQPLASENAASHSSQRPVGNGSASSQDTRSPPKSPEEFNPDPGVPPVRLRPPALLPAPWKKTVSTNATQAPQPPDRFNPDPGQWANPPTRERVPSFLQPLPSYGSEPIRPDLRLPRQALPRIEWRPTEAAATPPQDPLPEALKLPRPDSRLNRRMPRDLRPPRYDSRELSAGHPTNSLSQPDRWRIGFSPWRRYTSGETETPYESPAPRLWHPYQQSIFKGDVPIIGQGIFLNVTASTATELEFRRIPTPGGISAARPDSAEFFGRSEQFFIQNNLAVSAELFRGETAFKPVQWAVKVQPVFNVNYIRARETGVVAPDPRGIDGGDNSIGGELEPLPDDLAGSASTSRTKDFLALQEAFAEVHLADLSDNYDFVALRAGNQVFNSDFRGFIFNDINLGARLFGNAGNNHYQYNLAGFDMREKETRSELNTFDARDQRVLIANIYRQDFIWKGYTAQLSFHANWDDAGRHFDRNGFIVRPAPIGSVRPHDVHAYYLGWAGDGHIGRLNLSHAFYQALGEDGFNGLAGRPVNINAQMAALELSYDRDWVRYKLSFFHASGDAETEDGTGRGFDTILDNPNFTGGPFSFYTRQGFNLGGTAVNLKQRNSLVPDLRTSKIEGQANFVNPGVFLAGVGSEIELTPKLRSFLNANYVRFAETDPIETALFADDIDAELGIDLSIGFQYRPFLTDNIVLSAGFGVLLPGRGYRDIYRKIETVPGFTRDREPGQVDDFLYSGVVGIVFTY